MSKISAKDATILINGSKFSTYTTAYEIQSSVDPIEATGFADGSKNYIPGMMTAKIAADMLWDATTSTGVIAKMKTAGQTGVVTIIPELYALGVPTVSLPYLQANFQPGASVSDILKIGNISFESYGSNNGAEYGKALYQGTVTSTTTSTGVDNLAASTVKYAAVLHVWTPTTTDTYVVKVQHSTNNSTWADLASFALNGNTITAERITGTGTVNQYRRILATRTGAAAESFGFTAVLYTA